MARSGRLDRGLSSYTAGGGKALLWRVRLQAGGDLLKKSGFPTKNEARDWYDDRKREQRAGTLDLSKWRRRGVPAETIEAAIDHYITTISGKKAAADERRYGAWWQEHFKGRAPASITLRDIELAQQSLAQSGRFGRRQTGTVNRYTDWFRHFCNTLIRHGAIEKNPVVGLARKTEPKGRVRYLTVAEEALLKGVLAPWQYDLVRFAILTGLRQEEQFSLHWSWIDPAQRVILLPDSKAGGAQPVHLNAEAVGILKRLKRRVKSEWVCVDDRGQRVYGVSFYKSVFAPVVEKLGLDGVVWHTCRDTFASRLAMSGNNQATIMSLGRWSSLRSVQKYMHLGAGHLKKAVESVSRYQEVSGQVSEPNRPKTVHRVSRRKT